MTPYRNGRERRHRSNIGRNPFIKKFWRVLMIMTAKNARERRARKLKNDFPYRSYTLFIKCLKKIFNKIQNEFYFKARVLSWR